jgi:hypothetical protein
MGSLPAVTVVRVDCHFDAPFGVRDFAGLEESRDAPVLRAAADALRDAGQAPARACARCSTGFAYEDSTG